MNTYLQGMYHTYYIGTPRKYIVHELYAHDRVRVRSNIWTVTRGRVVRFIFRYKNPLCNFARQPDYNDNDTYQGCGPI